MHVFALIMGEAGFLTHLGALPGLTLLYTLMLAAQSSIENRFGIFIDGLSSGEQMTQNINERHLPLELVRANPNLLTETVDNSVNNI